MRSPTIQPSRSFAWMRSRFLSMPRFALRKRRILASQPNEIASTSDAARPTSFAAKNPRVGRHFTFATPDRSAFEFAKVIFQLALRYVGVKTIHLVVDNLNIHSQKSLTDALGDEVGADVWGRFTVHYTPRHGSWLNQAEIEIGLFARQCLGKRRIPTLPHLQRESNAWNGRMNRDKVAINRQFTRQKARQTFGYDKNSFTRS